jgi:hypothetical protein
MLSTTQALKEWDSVLKLLADIKTHAAAHPEQPTIPIVLECRVTLTVDALSRELASPVATWNQPLERLQKKVGA